MREPTSPPPSAPEPISPLGHHEDNQTETLDDKKWSTKSLIRHAERSHSKLPGIRKVPLRSIAVILLVAVVNVVVWVAVAVVLVCYSSLSQSFGGGLTLSCVEISSVSCS
jgi:hypothetical protein